VDKRHLIHPDAALGPVQQVAGVEPHDVGADPRPRLDVHQAERVSAVCPAITVYIC